MAVYLAQCGQESRVMEKYGAVRSRILVQSIKNLKDHEKSTSGSSSHMMTIGKYVLDANADSSDELVREFPPFSFATT